MSDNEVYTEINGTRVCISKIDARVPKSEQQEKLKVILRKMQKATVVDMGIDAAYIAVLENERREKGIQNFDPSVNHQVNITFPQSEPVGS